MELNKINQAAQLIKQGELVAFPTETVYGLGADALNPYAVAKIFEMKERPKFDPLIIHIANLEDIHRLTENVDERVFKLAEKFWPGPLTLVLPKSKIVPDIVSGDLPTVAIRMPNHEIALELIKQSECCIAAPSANKFGRISPTTAEHVRKQLPKLQCIIDGGRTKVGIESTVITLNTDGFVILRQGIITQTDLETVLPKSEKKIKKENQLASPGLLKSHYSPNKPIYLQGNIDFVPDRSKAGFISFSNQDIEGYKLVEILTKTGDLKEAAANLFNAMHKLEESDVDYIIAESIAEQGIGKAIMDKLHKASYQYNKTK